MSDGDQSLTRLLFFIGDTGGHRSAAKAVTQGLDHAVKDTP